MTGVSFPGAVPVKRHESPVYPEGIDRLSLLRQGGVAAALQTLSGGYFQGTRPGAAGATGFFGCLGFFFSRLLRC